MPRPTYEDVHIDAVLSNFSVDRSAIQLGFIADVLFPQVPVARRGDKYYTFTGDEKLKVNTYEQKVEDRSKATEVEWATGSDNYYCDNYRLRHFVDDDTLTNADAPVDVRGRTAEMIVDLMNLGREVRARDLLLDTTVSIPTAAAAAAWDQSTTYIEKDIDAAKRSIFLAGHLAPTHIVLSPILKDWLKRSTEVRALRKFTDERLLIDGEIPPVLFGLQVVVPGLIYDTANPGATISPAFLWEKNSAGDANKAAIILAVTPTPGLNVNSAGYHFTCNSKWTPFSSAIYREPGLYGEWIEVFLQETEKLVNVSAIYQISGCLT